METEWQRYDGLEGAYILQISPAEDILVGDNGIFYTRETGSKSHSEDILNNAYGIEVLVNNRLNVCPTTVLKHAKLVTEKPGLPEDLRKRLEGLIKSVKERFE